MKIPTIVLALCAAASLCVLGAGQSGDAPPAKLRVGTYDNRAIAVAYAASRFNPVSERVKELRAAEAAKDEARIRELNAWGEKTQRALHRQGFGRVPVDDLLVHVKERFPEVAQELDLDAIAWQVDYAGAEVEVVDATSALVALFDPSAKTLATVAELRQHPHADLDEIERGHEH